MAQSHIPRSGLLEAGTVTQFDRLSYLAFPEAGLALFLCRWA